MKDEKHEKQDTKIWLQVQETIDGGVGRITFLVKEICTLVDLRHGEQLRAICNEYNCKMWLMVDPNGGNPFLIRPLLYIAFNAPSDATMQQWRPISKILDKMLSNYRITAKLLDAQYCGEFQRSYP